MDAEVLRAAHRFDSAIYLCGYAVEIQLKVAVCRTLGWAGFPSSRREFEDLRSFKTHDLVVLLHLSGREQEVSNLYPNEWKEVITWDRENGLLPAWGGRRTGSVQDARCCHDNRRVPVDPFIFRLVSFEDHLEREHGRTCLFALVRRHAFMERWDVYVSASWLECDPDRAGEYIREKLRAWMEREDQMQLGIVDAAAPCDPFVSALIERVRGHEILHQIDEVVFDDVKYDRIIVINSCGAA